MKEIIERVRTDQRYLKNIEYGEPRSGHPEGKVKHHIADLEKNLKKLSGHDISEGHYWKLKFLIHVHDTFKADATPDSPIHSAHSHASLARQFASEFTGDPDLLNMIQYHDVNFALWKQFSSTGSYDLNRLKELINTIVDWDLFLMFIIIDGCTPGKDHAKISWFLQQIQGQVRTVVDDSWIL